MNFFKKILNTVTICCLMTLLMSLSCSKSEDEPVVATVRAFNLQYGYDKDVIEKYLKGYTYSINPNNDITFTKIPTDGIQPSIFSLLNATTFPKLLYKEVALHDITYKVYYLVFNEGDTSKKPYPVDEVLTAYRGFYLENNEGVLGVTPDFENNPFPTTTFSLATVFVRGWREIFPEFGAGSVNTTGDPNGPTTYQNYGVGTIFIPSGLAYFNLAQPTIPSYSPLVFNIKLFAIKRADQDGDTISSNDEIVKNADGSFTYTDTDGDSVPNYFDSDDDADGYLTKAELKKTDGSYYNFNEIPDCSGNTTSPTRIKKHLDKNCH